MVEPIRVLLRFQLREQDDVADAFLAEEHHAKAINAQAHAACRRHPVFKRDQEVFVELLLFAVRARRMVCAMLGSRLEGVKS